MHYVLCTILTVLATRSAASGEISKIDETKTRISIIADRLANYFEANHELPDALADMAEFAWPSRFRGQADADLRNYKDSWGNTIQYLKDGDQSFTLVSLGSDNQPGGSNDKADVIRSFDVTVVAIQR